MQRPLRMVCVTESVTQNITPQTQSQRITQAMKRRKMHKLIGHMEKVTQYLGFVLVRYHTNDAGRV